MSVEPYGSQGFSGRMPRPNVLVCNDDGIHAPGVRAMVNALAELNVCKLFVCCPATEQSGKSQSITLGGAVVTRRLRNNCHPRAACSIEVHGTPADAVMVATCSDLFRSEVSQWDLVVSGINRGDNLGLHVIYSGTVGAAREAACKGLAAVSFSLASYKADTVEAFSQAATYCAAFVKALLARWSGCMAPELQRNVINVNVPSPSGGNYKGFFLATMSRSSVISGFHVAPDDLKARVLQCINLSHSDPDVSVLTNTKTTYQDDMTAGSDFWAVRHGYISVTPLDLMQDFAISAEHLGRGREFVSMVWEIMTDVAAQMNVAADRCDVPKL